MTTRTNTHGETPAPHIGCSNPESCDCDCIECKRIWFNAGRPLPPKPSRIPTTLSDKHCALLVHMALKDLPPNTTYDDVLVWVRGKLAEQ